MRWTTTSPAKLDEQAAVGIVAIDLAAFVSTAGHMPQGTRKIETKLARQEVAKGKANGGAAGRVWEQNHPSGMGPGRVKLIFQMRPQLNIARIEPASQHMFAKGRLPADENDFNQKLGAAIGTFRSDLVSEHPTLGFACAGFTPDHELLDGAGLLIESKYVRGSTTPGKIRDPISADITNTPPGKHLLVLVFDPESAIPDRRSFESEFESKGCTLRVLS